MPMKICENLHGLMWRSMTANNCNTYVITGPKNILIDPGHLQHFHQVESELKVLNLTPRDIDLVLCTHAHPDHLEGVQVFKRAGVKFGLHARDWALVQDMLPRLGAAANTDPGEIAPDFFLEEGDLHVDGIHLEVLHTPGHSPGSLCFFWPLHKALISGDLVFREGIGRTDLPGGDSPALKQSLQKTASLPAELLLPGHGEIVSGRDDVQRNFDRINQVYLGYL